VILFADWIETSRLGSKALRDLWTSRNQKSICSIATLVTPFRNAVQPVNLDVLDRSPLKVRARIQVEVRKEVGPEIPKIASKSMADLMIDVLVEIASGTKSRRVVYGVDPVV
jgi:hypothetical protein